MHTVRWIPIALAPLVAACMMGGVAHTSGIGGAGPGRVGQTLEPLRYAEARGEGVTIELSFPTPGRGGPVTMDARLTEAEGLHAPIAGEVRLRIATPNGRVDEIRMERFQAPDGTVYRTVYDFRTPGSYRVTALGSVTTETEARSASVTTRVEVGDVAYHDRHDWMMPMAIVGGLGMMVMMAVMMSN